MMTRISNRDWEALSAYLDGQLSLKERDRLEARLKASADLQDALEQLRRTRSVLRSLPPVRAPRNFTLTPQMVRARAAPSPAYPIFRFASALAAVLLVLVLLGDFLTPRMMASAPTSAALLVQATTVVKGAASEPSAAATVAPQSPSEAPMLQALPADSALATEESARQTEAPPGLGAGEPEGTGVAGITVAQPTPEASLKTFQELAVTPTPTPEIASALPVEPTPEIVARAAEAQAPDQAAGQRQAQGSTTENILRLLEVALAVVVLATGLTAIYLRRKAR